MLELFRNTLPAWQWAILALIPPAIVALYFLKLKRQPLEVPSTYLWKRTIEDLHVNSLWQRLRQNLLLFLQLLLIGLAMLALLRPGWEGEKLTGSRFIFLVDHSASMSADDAEGAKSRLEESKRVVGGLIDQMDANMSAMIVSFSDSPQVVQEFTNNRRLLRERLEAIQSSVHATNLKGAIELASGLAGSSQPGDEASEEESKVANLPSATVYIVSDGRFEGVDGVSLGNLKPVYVPIGSFDAKNIGITSFSTRRSEAKPEERQAFVQITNFTDEPQKTIVEIQLDGQFLDAKEVEMKPHELGGVVFPLADAPPGELTATLKYEMNTPNKLDALRQDDSAFAALNDSRPGRVLVVTPGNTALEVALATERMRKLGAIEIQSPEVLQTAQYKKDADGGVYDLIVYDQCSPASMPRANTLFVGRLPPGNTWRGNPQSPAPSDTSSNDTGKANPESEENGQNTKAGDQKAEASPPASSDSIVSLPQIIDWNRAHPLLTSVELGNVTVLDSLLLTPPQGATVLIDSTAGPIAAVAPRDSYQDAVLGFEIVGQKDGALTANTNWPSKLSFPTFCINALEYLASDREESLNNSIPPGRTVELRAPAAVTEITVVDPAGNERKLKRSPQDNFQYHDTRQLGVYEVRQGDQVTERFAVNLFDRQESDIRVRLAEDSDAEVTRAADIRIGHSEIEAEEGRTPARKEVWKAVLACALAVLVFEWYIYNRRVYL